MQLLLSDDPEKFTINSDLEYKNGKVRAVIEIKEGMELVIIEGFEEEGRYAHLIDGMIFLDKLCQISKMPEINYIRSPSKSAPDKNLQ